MAVKVRKVKQPEILNNLPQDLRKISYAQFEAWVRWFAATKKLEGKDGLREYQEFQESQMKSAYQQLQTAKNPTVRERLERGHANGDVCLHVATAAVALQTWGDDEPDCWKVHMPRFLQEFDKTEIRDNKGRTKLRIGAVCVKCHKPILDEQYKLRTWKSLCMVAPAYNCSHVGC